MLMKSTLIELQGEYEKSIAVQQTVIDKNRKRLNDAMRKHNFHEIKRLNSLLKVLYEEKTELERAARDMRAYQS